MPMQVVNVLRLESGCSLCSLQRRDAALLRKSGIFDTRLATGPIEEFITEKDINKVEKLDITSLSKDIISSVIELSL